MLSQESFAYPFRDQRWGAKVLIGSVLSLAGYLIPVIPILFVLGYVTRSMRQAVSGDILRLPEWNDWADLGLRGLYSFLVYIVYLIPGLLMILCSAITFVAGQVLASGRAREGLIPGLLSWVVGLGPLSIVLAVLIFLAGLLVLFAGILLSPVAAARFVATDNLARAFDLDEVWRPIKSQLGDFVVIWAVYLGYCYAVGFVTMILYYSVCLCLLIPVIAAPAWFYGLLVSMPLFARLYARGGSARPPSLSAPVPPSSGSGGPGETVEPQPEAGPPSSGGQQPPGGPSAPAAEGFPYEVRGPILSVPVDPYEISLDELSLPARIQGCLMDAGLVSIGHVMEALRGREERLLEVKGFGPRSLEVVRDRLAHRGFAL